MTPESCSGAMHVPVACRATSQGYKSKHQLCLSMRPGQLAAVWCIVGCCRRICLTFCLDPRHPAAGAVTTLVYTAQDAAAKIGPGIRYVVVGSVVSPVDGSTLVRCFTLHRIDGRCPDALVLITLSAGWLMGPAWSS